LTIFERLDYDDTEYNQFFCGIVFISPAIQPEEQMIMPFFAANNVILTLEQLTDLNGEFIAKRSIVNLNQKGGLS
jgi:hypothetical protein